MTAVCPVRWIKDKKCYGDLKVLPRNLRICADQKDSSRASYIGAHIGYLYPLGQPFRRVSALPEIRVSAFHYKLWHYDVGNQKYTKVSHPRSSVYIQ